MTNSQVKRWAIAAVALALGAGLGACGDDDGDEASSSGATTTTAATETSSDGASGDEGGGGADLAAACATEAQLNPAVQDIPFPEGDEATPEETEAAIAYYDEEIAPLVADLRATAPDEIGDQVAAVDEAISVFGESGDFALIEDTGPGSPYAAFNDLAGFFFEECGDPQVAVSAVNYAFNGDVPASVGLNRIHFTNDGEDIHEMVLFRRNDGVTDAFADIFAMEDQAAAEELVEFVAAGFAAPGEDAYAEADLEPGDYAMVCFVPIGVTSEDQFETADAPPHFTAGMLREFTVE